MTINRPIIESLQGTRPVISVEFYPPKTEEGGRQILETAQLLREHLKPEFVSITYGAGGSTRDRTLRYARILKDEMGFQVMPHLTCVGSSKDDLLEIIRGYESEGFRNVMALRGDPPKGQSDFKPHPDGCRFASELVALIRENTKSICIGVAGYPEKHPEASCMDTDVAYLKQKVANGADFVTTQLFYDNQSYFSYVDQCRKAGIEVPIVPGILPALSLKQAKRFCEFGNTLFPQELEARLSACGEDEKAAEKEGVNWAYEQIRELVDRGAPAIHLYVMNRPEAALSLAGRLRSDGLGI